ncbi:MAG: BrnT family toxin, partial [candidate division NC10 bacterium]
MPSFHAAHAFRLPTPSGRSTAARAASPYLDRPTEFTIAPRAPLDLEDNRLYARGVRFEWDPPKARANLRAHGVSFAEAVTVLDDDLALTREDPDAADESRFVTLGLSDVGNLLVVVYAYREPDMLRVISAWKANKRQRVLYE